MSVSEKASADWSPGLTPDDRQTLMDIAQQTLDWVVHEPKTLWDFDSYFISDALRLPLATFVTLRQADHRLRGCIGSLTAFEPLFESVHSNAEGAAVRDSRFQPLAVHERPGLLVDISILSPIEEVPSVDAIQLGQHGVILEMHGRRSVFLPEVARAQGWDLEQMLNALAEKASLPAESWREPQCRFSIFSSVVLEEES